MAADRHALLRSNRDGGHSSSSPPPVSTPSTGAWGKGTLSGYRPAFASSFGIAKGPSGIWVVASLIGLSIGAVGYALYSLIDLISGWRIGTAVRLLSASTAGGVIGGAFGNLGISCCLCLLSSVACVFVCPAATFSGVPEIMSYLNGVQMRESLALRTGAAKFVSNLLAVSSGLPIGPEGPMIHIGAVVGSCIARFLRGVRGPSSSSLTIVNKREERDFITAGVGAGVAVAFGAPLGGLLFAFEEVSSGIAASVSGYGNTLVLMVFFSCLCGVFSAGMLKSSEHFFAGGGKAGFGVFDNEWSIAYEVTKLVNNHIYVVIIGAMIGCVCGALGALFSSAVVAITRAKRRLFSRIGDDCRSTAPDTEYTALHHDDILDRAGAAPAAPAASSRSRRSSMQQWAKVLDTVAVLMVFMSVSMLLSASAPCTRADCFIGGDGAFTCPGTEKAGTEEAAAAARFAQHGVTENVETSTCGSSIDGGGGGGEGIMYSEFGSLMLGSGHNTVSQLLSRETPRQFSYGVLLAFLAVYFTFSCIAATTHVASGIFVPMLVIGSCVGRIVGLAVVDIFKTFNVDAVTSFKWEWIDPGIFALIGCGAFMGGVTRLTVSIAVITMEITNEVRFLLPIMTAIMAAKYVADRLMPTPLYHALIDLRRIPFLHMRPDVGKLLDLYDTVELLGSGDDGCSNGFLHHLQHEQQQQAEEEEVMGDPGQRLISGDDGLSESRFSGVVCVRELESIGNIKRVLSRTTHHSFPVVKPSASTSDFHVYAGVISRHHLHRILLHEMSSDAVDTALAYEQLVQSSSDEDDLSWQWQSHRSRHQGRGARNGGVGVSRPKMASDGRAVNGSGRGSPDGIAMMAVRREPSSSSSSLSSRDADFSGLDHDSIGGDTIRVDLRDYVDHAAMSIYNTTPVGRCYDIFVVMGCRCLVVVNENNAVVGILTRKDLLPERVEAVLELDANGFEDLEL